MSGDICNDNRFEVIEKYRQKLTEATNIETSPDEMAVLDSILFRFWQMGWLDRLEERKTGTWNRYYKMHSGDTFVCNRCGSCFVVLQGEDKMNFCPNCGSDNRG